MLLEPNQTPYDLKFQVFGIPVRVHPFFWVIAALFGMSIREPGALMIWVGVVFVSVLVHELGHALTARYFGCDPWITLYGMGGLASYRPRFHEGWKHILILLAGPGAGFLLATFVALAVALSGHLVVLHFPGTQGVLIGEGESLRNPRLFELVSFLLFVNIFWGIINLLPVYPLDGGQIARHVFGYLNPRDGLRQALWLSVLAGGMLAAMGLMSGDLFFAIFFGYLAFNSYQALQGSGGGYGW